MKVTRVNFTFCRMADELIPKWLNNTFDNISDIARNILPPPLRWACYLKSGLSFMNNLLRLAFQPLVLHTHSVLHFAAFRSKVGWHSIIAAFDSHVSVWPERFTLAAFNEKPFFIKESLLNVISIPYLIP